MNETTWWKRNWKWVVGLTLTLALAMPTEADGEGGGATALLVLGGFVLLIWGLIEVANRRGGE